jgi:hypothetical protein
VDVNCVWNSLNIGSYMTCWHLKGGDWSKRSGYVENVHTLFRLFREWQECPDCVQTMLLMFRPCTDNVNTVQTVKNTMRFANIQVSIEFY